MYRMSTGHGAGNAQLGTETQGWVWCLVFWQALCCVITTWCHSYSVAQMHFHISGTLPRALMHICMTTRFICVKLGVRGTDSQHQEGAAWPACVHDVLSSVQAQPDALHPRCCMMLGGQEGRDADSEGCHMMGVAEVPRGRNPTSTNGGTVLGAMSPPMQHSSGIYTKLRNIPCEHDIIKPNAAS